jgi:lysophospholipase L1-like esterase
VIFETGNRVVFVGDSNSDAGRRESEPPYGNGYVSLLRALLTASRLELRLGWVNRGVSGDAVRDLEQRWERDAMGTKADWLPVKIGINDVWNAFRDNPARAVPIDEFEVRPPLR